MVDLSIVIPVKDEEKNIVELILRISNTINKMNLSYEIVFVTDINKDNTFELLKSLNKQDKKVKVIKLSNSYGHHVAVIAGLNYCCGKAVVIMDGDLQDYPEDIPKLYEKSQEGYDVVYGTKARKNDSIMRNLFSKTFIKLLNKLSDYKLDYNTCMFRIMSRRTVEEILKFREREPVLTGIISLIGFPAAKVIVTSGKRKVGKTKYNFLRQVNLSVSFLLSFSTKPLRICSICGFFTSCLSFVYLLIVIIQKTLFNIDVLGWPTLVSLITFLGGIQLFFIGIIGEYIGRIFMETKNRPLYIVQKKIGDLG